MVSTRSLLGGAALSFSSVQAISAGCTAGVTSLAFGDLGSCLALTQLLPVLSNSGSIVSNINTYLGSLCSSSTPTCSNATLTSAASSIQSSCASDISSGGSTASEVDVLLIAINAYPQVYAAGCSKNSTTNGYCVTETLSNIQNSTGTQISVSALTSLLSGDTSSLSNLNSGVLCTGCVDEIYQQVAAVNSSIASSTVGKALSSQCGSSFAASGTPSGVSMVASAASTAKTSGASSSSSSTGAGYTNAVVSGPLVIAGATLLSAAILGSALVL